ncbi:transcriptional regulator, AsnC family [Desulfocurvibacter africanus PCS]|uniref:siroheme decarboxylase n=1 Tax=Desulfocurvibacter africanus PCS TaxID=1262666 RepID=M5PS53_DESAF|nr:Lrp/AsnC family transcriptional regulator [Desulfocurvibacter africanus]EMG36895.1 transcriptional regulator, AsnC family [Desulfocurvibacter africanus PCS]
MSNPTFSQAQKRALAMVQADLPDSATPFADIAAQAGLGEDEVLELLRGLKTAGVIRRFGATLRHQKAGYGHNAMVAWYVEADKDMDQVAKVMADRPEISHCYHRKDCLDWPYNLYTMIHGQNPGDCLRLARELAVATGVDQYDVLESVRELKKTSMRYFEDQNPQTAHSGQSGK